MTKKVKYYPISHGHVVASWYVLYLASKYAGISPKNVVGIAEASGKLGGTLPIREGLRLCLDYGFLRIAEERLRLSEASELRIVSKCSDEDPNTDVLREILAQILSQHNFDWLIYYDEDPDIFRTYITGVDSEWANLLDNAKLFQFDDEEVNSWWNRILVKYESNKELIKAKVGDVGEKLTYHHELHRVQADGIMPAKTFVKWASRISDRFGFDVLSIRGSLFGTLVNQKEKIQIEVKASEIPNIQNFRFYVSRGEWYKAQENLNSYYFYCWAGISIEHDSAQNGPYVIPAEALAAQIPKDVGTICSWSECRFVIDLSSYKT